MRGSLFLAAFAYAASAFSCELATDCGTCLGAETDCYWCGDEASCLSPHDYANSPRLTCAAASFDASQCDKPQRRQATTTTSIPPATASPTRRAVTLATDMPPNTPATDMPPNTPATDMPPNTPTGSPTRVTPVTAMPPNSPTAFEDGDEPATTPPTRREPTDREIDPIPTVLPPVDETEPPVVPTVLPVDETDPVVPTVLPVDESGDERIPPATCRQLGWKVQVAARGTGICAESRINGECALAVTHSAAVRLCASVGARLCTPEELTHNVAAGSGCQGDMVRSWTSASCVGGHITQAGGRGFLPLVEPLCSADASLLQARCCADDPVGPPPLPAIAPKTCEELQWEPGPGGKGNLCASSVVNGVCYIAASHRTATEACASVGARLCTRLELSNNEAWKTGCKLDKDRVWAQDPCGTQPGFFVSMSGSASVEEVPEACSADDETLAGVRCCQDQPWADSRQSCESLYWLHFGLEDVCAESKILGECHTALTHDAAGQMCAKHGARLCSFDELESNVAVGSGCKLDTKRVWSSSSCAGGFMSTKGSSFAVDVLPACSPPSTPLAVRCCADSATAVARRQGKGKGAGGARRRLGKLRF